MDSLKQEVAELRRLNEASHAEKVLVEEGLEAAKAQLGEAEAASDALQEELASERENAKLARDAESQATIEALQAKIDAAAEARAEADRQLADAAAAADEARQAAGAEHEAVLRRSREELDEARAATARAEGGRRGGRASRASVEALRDEGVRNQTACAASAILYKPSATNCAPKSARRQQA